MVSPAGTSPTPPTPEPGPAAAEEEEVAARYGNRGSPPPFGAPASAPSTGVARSIEADIAAQNTAGAAPVATPYVGGSGAAAPVRETPDVAAPLNGISQAAAPSKGTSPEAAAAQDVAALLPAPAKAPGSVSVLTQPQIALDALLAPTPTASEAIAAVASQLQSAGPNEPVQLTATLRLVGELVDPWSLSQEQLLLSALYTALTGLDANVEVTGHSLVGSHLQ